MDQEVLVDLPPIEEGFEFLRRVAREGHVSVAVAFWAKRDPQSLWNLWVGVDTDDESDAISAIIHLILSLRKDSAIRAQQLNAVIRTDPAANVAILARELANASGHLVREGPSELLRPSGLHEIIIYPKIGKMSASEVAVSLAHEMNRAGESSPVTLTLADGAEVRGYPLAIRKSAVGGAMVELADADTKGKGADVPLDRIFSVVPDSLTP